MENKEKETTWLENLKKADPPPFLYTRIEARIAGLRSSRMPASWAWSTAIAMFILVMSNVYLLSDGFRFNRHDNEVARAVRSLHMLNSNQLYDE